MTASERVQDIIDRVGDRFLQLESCAFLRGVIATGSDRTHEARRRICCALLQHRRLFRCVGYSRLFH